MTEYEILKAIIQFLYPRGRKPTRAEHIDWAYGNAACDNPKVTREMAARAVDAALACTCSNGCKSSNCDGRR